jgi:hypothetical protein
MFRLYFEAIIGQYHSKKYSVKNLTANYVMRSYSYTG